MADVGLLPVCVDVRLVFPQCCSVWHIDDNVIFNTAVIFSFFWVVQYLQSIPAAVVALVFGSLRTVEELGSSLSSVFPEEFAILIVHKLLV